MDLPDKIGFKKKNQKNPMKPPRRGQNFECHNPEKLHLNSRLEVMSNENYCYFTVSGGSLNLTELPSVQ